MVVVDAMENQEQLELQPLSLNVGGADAIAGLGPYRDIRHQQTKEQN